MIKPDNRQLDYFHSTFIDGTLCYDSWLFPDSIVSASLAKLCITMEDVDFVCKVAVRTNYEMMVPTAVLDKYDRVRQAYNTACDLLMSLPIEDRGDVFVPESIVKLKGVPPISQDIELEQRKE